MTGKDLKEMADGLIDDVIEETLFYQLLNIAKTNLEEKKDWEYLKTVDSSNSVSSVTTYLTEINLPTRFRSVARMYLSIDSSSVDSDPLMGIKYEEREKFQNAGGRYYVDYANGTFSLTGTFSTIRTIHLFYLQYTEDIEKDTSPTFPDRFHSILAFLVAGYYTAGVDADDIYARMSPAHRFAAKELETAMNMWDNKIKLNAIDYSAV